MTDTARRSSLALTALLSLTTSLTSLAGVALAETVPTAVPQQVPVAAPVPPSPAARAVAPKPKPVTKRHVVRVAPKPAPSPKPSPKPTPTHASPKPVATKATTAPRATTTQSSLTPRELMMRAVSRIPGYRTGDAEWVMRRQSNWGLALMGGGTVYIATDVPANRMYDVVSHEWSHLLSVRDYGNQVQTALDAMNAYFGGTGLTGSERAADCMAKLLGATWTHYTPCTNSRWIAGAKKLVAGQRL